MRIRLVTFDLDNTLWDTHGVLQNAQDAMTAWIKDRVPEYSTLSADTHRGLFREVLATQREISHDISLVRIAVLKRTFEECGYDRERAMKFAYGAFQVLYEWRQRVSPFPEAAPLLEKLSERYTLISLTNGNADASRTAIAKYFMHHVTAASAGAMKPAPEPFLKAIALAGGKAETSVHVGDNLEDDIKGAQNVGMHAVWVNYEGSGSDSTSLPTVSRLSEVEHVLDELERRLSS